MRTALILCLAIAQAAHAQSGHAPGAEATIRVAAGLRNHGDYSTIFPIIASQFASSNIALIPDETTGSVMSATAVCLGQDEAAIVQSDAADDRAHNADDCSDKYLRLGRPLYPYYGFWVVRADARFTHVSGQIASIHKGQALKVAAGQEGSGGQVTLSNLLDSDPSWRASVQVRTEGGESALRLLRDKGIDAYFIMDVRNSAMIEEAIKEDVDEHKRPVFKFLSVNPPVNFFGTRDWTNNLMYQPEKLTRKRFGGIRTISTDAILIVGKAWWRRDATTRDLAAQLGRAIRTVEPAMRAATQAPTNWVPASVEK